MEQSGSPRCAVIPSGTEVLMEHAQMLTQGEKSEIVNFDKVYFFGTEAAKGERHKKLRQIPRYNAGYDDKNGLYKFIKGDHLYYRYELIEEVGAGAFGQVFKCYDHKDKLYVAVKVNKNENDNGSASKGEIALLNRVKMTYKK
mmetsp:Transcript_74516/g.103524  ORF Transcript_74516/g.103524 Transcript_74516/m.103524 type:complete len:143 (-) Transcript_74516:103-531(-)